MPLKGIFFDLYGTLLNYDDLESAWKDWLDSLYESFTQSDMSMSRSEFSEFCKKFYDDQSFYDRPKSDAYTVFEQRINNLAGKLGVELDDVHTTADRGADAWQKHLTFDSQAEPLLRSLKKDRTIVLLSNFDHPRHIHKLLENQGWSTLFDYVVISGELGVLKPDVKIFEHALELTSLSPGEVIHVGDSYEDDIVGAYNAGITPVFVNKEVNGRRKLNYSPHSADFGRGSLVQLPPGTHCIERLDELMAVCEEFSA